MKIDKSDFLQEYTHLFDYVYRYIHARIDHAETCKDLVSEVFIKALEHLSDFDADKGSLQQWMTGIVKHHLYNFWKRQRKTIPLDDLELPTTPEFNQLAFDQLIAHLPVQTRQLLIWRYVDDLTYDQIAHLTNKSAAAIRQYYSRLHKQLREYYEHT